MFAKMDQRLAGFASGLLYVIVALTPLFYLRKGVYPYILAKTLFLQGAVEILFFVWLALALLRPEYRPRMSRLCWGMLGFFAALIVAAIFGEDVFRSFWSTQERASGIVLFLHLGALALVVASLMRALDWKKLIAVSLATSGAVSALAILQLWIPDLLLIESVGTRPGSTFGNPTFFAGYLGFHFFIGAYLLIAQWRAHRRIGAAHVLWILAALVLDSIAFFNAQTRGDILGVAAGAAALLTLFAFRPLDIGPPALRRRSTYIALAGALLVIGGVFWLTRAAPFWQSVPGLGRFADISIANQALRPRLIALRAGWKGFLEKPWLGWGPENYNVVFNKYYEPEALEISYLETRFDKPHNLYLEYLVAGGTILLAAFAIFIFLLFRTFLRLRDRLLGALLIGALASYLVRSVFVFDTLGPLMMLYLLAGIVEGLRRGEHETAAPATPRRFVLEDKLLAGGVVAMGFLLAYVVNILSLKATYYQYYGFRYFVTNRPEQAIASFKRAIAIWSPYRWNLKRDYAAAVAEAYFYNPGRVSKENARAAVAAAEEAAREHPNDAYGHYMLVDMYNQISDIDPEYYLGVAEREAAYALSLSPDRQEVYFSLAKTKSLRLDYQGALQLLDYAIALDPKVPDAHFYYGLIAYAAGDYERGYREIKTALALGRPWRNHNEPRVVANFFANSGYLDEAIELYKKSLAMKEDPEARVKLGMAYYTAGDRDAARREIAAAMQTFDITRSPSYETFLPILEDLRLLGQ